MKFGDDQGKPNKSSLAGDPKKQQEKQGTQVSVKKHAVTQVSNDTEQYPFPRYFQYLPVDSNF